MMEREALDRKPLAGRHIAITRSPEQAPELAITLESLGARVTVLSAIAIRPVEDTSELDAALTTLAEYDWIALTSANGVHAVAERLKALGIDWDTRRRARIAVIGPATARALEECGVTPDLVPERYVAESILDGLANVAGQRILLLRADIARRTLAEELLLRGAEVNEVAAYRTELLPVDRATLEDMFLRDAVDAITFTSSSTVRGLVTSLRSAQMEPTRTLSGTAICAIGPITATTLRDYGLEPIIVAEDYTIPGLVDALCRHFAAGAPA